MPHRRNPQRLAAVTLVTASLLCFSSSTSRATPQEAVRVPEAKREGALESGNERPAGHPARTEHAGKAARGAPPPRRKLQAKPRNKRVPLPLAGSYTAKDFAPSIGALWGKPVEFTAAHVEQTTIRIDKAIAEQYVGSEELTLMLAAHRIYLVPHVRPNGTEVLMVTRDPTWRPEPPRFRKVLEISLGHFERVWTAVESAVKTANSKLAKGESPVGAVPAKRRGKIFLGAGSRQRLDSIQIVASDTRRATQPNRPRFYIYVGRSHRVEELLTQTEAELSEGERNRLRIIVAHRGNRLLFRAPPAVGDKVQRLLEKFDRKSTRRSR